jgi:hypothetical protein
MSRSFFGKRTRGQFRRDDLPGRALSQTPPTLRRWRHDWQATLAADSTLSTDPASVEQRLAGYTRGRTQRSPPTLCRWSNDWQATLAAGLNALHRPCVGGETIGRLGSSVKSHAPLTQVGRKATVTDGALAFNRPSHRHRVAGEGNWHGRRFSLQSSLPPTQGRWRGNWHGRRFSLQSSLPPTQGRWSIRFSQPLRVGLNCFSGF